MTTYTSGCTFLTTRDITNMDIVAICNDLSDQVHTFVPERITEGGILFASWPGKTDKQYKSMRFCFSKGRWPYLRDDNSLKAMEEQECVIAPKGTTVTTFLKAFNGAPVWNIDEIIKFNTVFYGRGFKLQGKLPTKKSLCVNK